eukprot:4681282-Alexandrium_andersonii.AAC.2
MPFGTDGYTLPLRSFYASGSATGIVVDSGDIVLHAVPPTRATRFPMASCAWTLWAATSQTTW